MWWNKRVAPSEVPFADGLAGYDRAFISNGAEGTDDGGLYAKDWNGGVRALGGAGTGGGTGLAGRTIVNVEPVELSETPVSLAGLDVLANSTYLVFCHASGLTDGGTAPAFVQLSVTGPAGSRVVGAAFGGYAASISENLANTADGLITTTDEAGACQLLGFTEVPDTILEEARLTLVRVGGTAENNDLDFTLSTSSIQEGNSIGDVVGNFIPDDPIESNTHEFDFIAGDGDSDNGSFTIVGTQLRADEVFDYDVKHIYSIRVRVTASDSSTFDRAFTISVLDDSSGEGDLTRVLYPTSISAPSASGGDGNSWYQVSGAANDQAGALASLLDSSDSTYLTRIYVSVTTFTILDVTAPENIDGRDIQSLEFVLRYQAERSSLIHAQPLNSSLPILTFAQAFISTLFQSGNGTQELVFGPFTNAAGATWTTGELDNAKMEFIVNAADTEYGAGNPKFMQLYTRVAYANEDGRATEDLFPEAPMATNGGAIAGDDIISPLVAASLFAVDAEFSGAAYLDDWHVYRHGASGGYDTDLDLIVHNGSNAPFAFRNPVHHDGRNIESFVVIVRCTSAADGVVSVEVGGVTVTGFATKTANYVEGNGVQNIAVGPFEKSGGGPWTPAQINAVTAKVTFTSQSVSGVALEDGGAFKITRITARVRYEE